MTKCPLCFWHPQSIKGLERIGESVQERVVVYKCTFCGSVLKEAGTMTFGYTMNGTPDAVARTGYIVVEVGQKLRELDSSRTP